VRGALNSSSPLMGEVAAKRPEWVTARFSDKCVATHSVIALARADSSPSKGEQVESRQ